MTRVSLAALMGFVVACAIGFAALTNADALWYGAILLLTVGLLGFSTLAVVYRRGASRARWLGFTLFGAGYLVMTTAPWFTDEVRPILPTTYVLQNMHRVLVFAHHAELSALRKQHEETVRRYVELREGRDKTARSTPLSVRRRDPEMKALEDQITSLEASMMSLASPPRYAPSGYRTHRESVGQTLFALLSGSLGALLASWLYRTREPAEERSL